MQIDPHQVCIPLVDVGTGVHGEAHALALGCYVVGGESMFSLLQNKTIDCAKADTAFTIIICIHFIDKTRQGLSYQRDNSTCFNNTRSPGIHL